MNEEDEVDNTLMLTMGAFSRRITNTWINPQGQWKRIKRIARRKTIQGLKDSNESPPSLFF